MGIAFLGNVTEFEVAMNSLIGSYARELAEAAAWGCEDEEHRQIFEGLKAAAEQCLRQYHAHMEILMQEWLQSEDEDVRMIGEAVRNHDYSGLNW